MDQVLLTQGLVQPEVRLNLGPHLRGEFRVLGIDRGVIAGLGLHQEEGQRDDQKKGHHVLAQPPGEVGQHQRTSPDSAIR